MIHPQRSIAIALAAGLAATAAAATPDTIEIRDHSVTGTTNWTSNHIYRMHGHVVVRSGSILNIQAGTLVLCDAYDQDSATILLIERGAKIYALGTLAQPIIFTSIFDVTGGKGAMPNDESHRGQWGGILILGRAPTSWPGGVGNVSKDISGDSAFVRFGDSTHADPHDNSGTLNFVSIRYTGISDIGTVKGLMLASVGDSTQIDHVEVYASAEDGINFMGGTVNAKHVVSTFSDGDAIMLGFGYRGMVQFVLNIQNNGTISGAGVNSKVETSGDSLGHLQTKFQMYNATYISTGDTTGYNGKYKYQLVFRQDGFGTFANSIITQSPFGGVFVDDSKILDSTRTSDSLGTAIVIKNNIFTHIGWGDSLNGVAAGLPFLATYLRANHNDTVDPVLGGYSWTQNKGLDPRPAIGGTAYQNVATVPVGFFTQTDYRGAFGQDNWAAGWTALSMGGFFKDAANVPTGIAVRGTIRPSTIRLVGRSVSLTLEQTGNVRIETLDLSGRRIDSRSFALSAGRHSVSLASQLHGLSVVRVRTSSAEESFLTNLP